jgi:hypothetical protein
METKFESEIQKNENCFHPFSVEILNDRKRGTRSKTEFLSETKCSKMN